MLCRAITTTRGKAVMNKLQYNSGGFKGGRNRRTPPLNVSQTAVKMVYKEFAGSSRIKNWINDNQQRWLIA